MNKDMFEINWKQIRNHTPSWWSLMDDHDLVEVDKADVEPDRSVTISPVNYGYTNQDAKRQIAKPLAGFVTLQKK
jgi:hypothetical protein